jgi:hypothetical protein
MRFAEIMEDSEPKNGLYVCVKFDKQTVKDLSKFVDDFKIKNPIVPSRYHTTIVYSKKPLFWRAEHDIGHEAKATGWEVWEDHNTKKPVLVLHLESSYLRTRFDLAMSRGASYDFPEYNPHISFSYDAGEGFDVESLPVPEFPIIIDKEIAEPLKP